MKRVLQGIVIMACAMFVTLTILIGEFGLEWGLSFLYREWDYGAELRTGVFLIFIVWDLLAVVLAIFLCMTLEDQY